VNKKTNMKVPCNPGIWQQTETTESTSYKSIRTCPAVLKKSFTGIRREKTAQRIKISIRSDTLARLVRKYELSLNDVSPVDMKAKRALWAVFLNSVF